MLPAQHRWHGGKLRSFAVSVQVIRYPGVGHIGIILSLVPGFRGTTACGRTCWTLFVRIDGEKDMSCPTG